MQILMTGSTGLIGSSVTKRLRLSHDLHTLGRQQGLVDSVIDFNCTNKITKLRLPTSNCLIHCAGVIDEDFKIDPMSAYQRATLGAEALLNAAVASGVKKFVYISSTHVYGPQIGVVTEFSPVNPQSHYALAHYCTEQLFRRYAASCQGLVVILRPNAVYGLPAHPSLFQRWSLIPFSFPREAKENGRITLKSSGLQRRNFVSTSAIADVIARCVDGDLDKEFGVINVLGAETESVYEFAQRCQKIAETQLGRPCKVERQQSYLDAALAKIGSDFDPISRFKQPRPANELDEFIMNFIKRC